VSELLYSPKNQYRVLKAIKAEVDRTRQNNKVFLLKIDDMADLEISFYCRLLEELGFIKAMSLDDPTGTYTYPVGITSKGDDFLAEANKSFWEHAEKIALLAFQKAINLDLEPFVDFFRYACTKYQQEKDI
jgi:hypothetical protein